MEAKYILQSIDKLNVDYVAGNPVREYELSKFERSIGTLLPEQFKFLYMEFNGLEIAVPKLEIYSLSKAGLFDHLLVFAKFDDIHEVALDLSEINVAEQRNIVTVETGYVVTLTMASFWSNKIFAWLRSGRRIWENEGYS